MIGRAWPFSTRTACAFIAVSVSPIPTPSRTSAPASRANVVAYAGATEVTHMVTAPAAVTGALPRRAIHRPVTWTARTLPTGTPSSASPRSPSVSPAWALSAGIRLASVPCTTPSRTNTVAVARRARRSLGAVGTRAP